MQSKLSKYFTKPPTTPKALDSASNFVDLTEEPSHAEVPSVQSRKPTQLLPPSEDQSRHERFKSAIMSHFDYIEREAQNRNVLPTPTSSSSYTPLEKQVLELRQKHPDCLLMIECGYRVRFFGDDAKVAAQVLGIYCHQDHNFLVASIPTYRTLVHCKRLVEAGHKVAIVRQLETAALKKAGKGSSGKTFSRAVSGIFTRGTMIDEDDPAFRGLIAEKKVKKADNDIDDDDEDDAALGEEDNADLASDEFFDEETAWVVSLHEEGSMLYLCAVNICGAKLSLVEIPIDSIRQGLQDQLDSYKSIEVIVSDSLSGDSLKPLRQRLATKTADASDGEKTVDTGSAAFRYIKQLITYSNVDSEKKACAALVEKYCSLGCRSEFVASLALLRKYLKAFGLEDALSNPDVSVNVGLKQDSSVKSSFSLDAVTARDLEVFSPLTIFPQASHKKQGYGSLFWLIDSCKSSYGRRTLKSWLSAPLLLRQDILDRQESVMWLANLDHSNWNYMMLVKLVIECFTKFPNVERTLSSLQFGRISVSSLKSLLQFGEKLSQIRISSGDKHVPTLLGEWIRSLNGEDIASVCSTFASKLLTDDSNTSLEGSLSSIFTPEAEAGIPELRHLAEQQNSARAKIQAVLDSIRTEIRMPLLQYSSLRTGATSVVEHLIELPVNFSKPIPSNWIKVSNTKSVMRFHTHEILRVQQELYSVRDEIKLTADRVWQKFILEVKEKLHAALRSSVHYLGKIDAILSLSEVAKYPNYCLPEYPEGSNTVYIRDGRHPVLSRILEDQGEAFVPNDINLSRNFQERSCQVLTGPNMGGKSSYVRMLGSICLLGQIGSCVPAEAATLCIFDNIFTRMGAEDDLSSGLSTFMCELIRTSKILHTATSNSLVMIDELGRGTSTHDGSAIALATLRHFIHKLGSMTVFVTHFPEIALYIEEEASDHNGRGCNAHMSYLETEGSEEEGQQVVFLYKLVDGPSKGSYGINVARLSGIPGVVLKRATEMSEWMRNKMQHQQDSRKRRRLNHYEPK